MNNVADIRTLLEGLVESTDSPVYSVCDEIVLYLESHPKQQDLTIGGLRTALNKWCSEDSIIIKAAFILTAHPFLVLEVRYKLYDEEIVEVLEELDHATYMKAISEGFFIDNEGDEVVSEDLNSRVFPYFINQLNADRGADDELSS